MRNGFLFTMFAICLFVVTEKAQSTEISFQGRLDNNSQPEDELEGVKYAQITTVLVNAANEQQKQLTSRET